MSRRAWVVLLALGLPLSAQSATAGGYYERKEEGWFWHEPVPVPAPPSSEPEAPPEVTNPTTEPAPAPAPLRPLSPAWFREKLPEYRDLAIENPTPENVRAYFYLQRYAMDLSERFAITAQKVVLADPALDENTRRPISTYGGQVFDQMAQENTARVAAKVASIAGVWYFYRSDCPYCRAQNPILERLAERIGLAVLPIALDGAAMPDGHFTRFVPNQGHAEQLGVTQTPTLFLVRKPNEFVLLSEGLVTDDGLLQRIVYAAHDAGWITDDEFNSTRAAKPAEPLTIASLDSASDVFSDPRKLVEFLQTQQPIP